jgi:HEPN domain-containing protein
LALALEKREAARDEYRRGRYTVVGDLAIKAVEQAIEALAAREDKHFHLRPRTAHAERIRWAKGRYPVLSPLLDALWGAYGTLGYEGKDGERAARVLESMERVFDVLAREAGLGPL